MAWTEVSPAAGLFLSLYLLVEPAVPSAEINRKSSHKRVVLKSSDNPVMPVIKWEKEILHTFLKSRKRIV